MESRISCLTGLSWIAKLRFAKGCIDLPHRRRFSGIVTVRRIHRSAGELASLL